MLRHLRANLIAYVALFLALSGGSFAIAALNRHDKRVIKKLVNKQITRRAPGLSVNRANTANEATHAGTADSATSANSANSVGGVSIEPVHMALPDGAPQTPIISIDGSSVNVGGCGSGLVQLEIIHTSSTSPPLSAELVRSNAGQPTAAFHAPSSLDVSYGDSAAHLNASIRESSGHVTRLDIDTFYEQNAFGGTDDCFVQGTIERFG
jgi:hypothetical protein